MKTHDFAYFYMPSRLPSRKKPQTHKKNKIKSSKTKQVCSHLHRMPDGSRLMLLRAQKCSEGQPLHWRAIGGNNWKHMYYISIYIYILYIYICMYVCMYVWMYMCVWLFDLCVDSCTDLFICLYTYISIYLDEYIYV